MFWRCDRTYICEKVANYSKRPQTSPYGAGPWILGACARKTDPGLKSPEIETPTIALFFQA